MSLLFLLKLTLCWGFFALLYGWLLHNETFFRANRAYLLGTLVLGILLSLDVDWLPALPATTLPLTVLPTVVVGLQRAEAVARPVGDYVWLVYLLGAGFMLLRFGWALLRLVKMAVRGAAEVLPDGCLLLRSDATAVPFSFFQWIFVPLDFQWNSDDRASDLEAMLIHERAHARGWHSADVLATELLCIIFWFHPLVHWYRRALRSVHEYLADAEASRRINLKQYGLLLIRQSQPGMPIALVHHFFQSPLKQRLIMLTKRASAPANTLKYGLLIPVTLLFGLLFRQAPAIAQGISSSDHLKRVHDLEANSWIEVDTLVLFDPVTYEQTTSTSRNNLAPYREPATGRQVYQICEQPPTYPGGEKALLQFLATNIHYPPAARADSLQGMLVMRFVVSADGTLRSIGENPGRSSMRHEFAEEARRAIALMPRWIPGEQNGQQVDCEVILPIRFQLD